MSVQVPDSESSHVDRTVTRDAVRLRRPAIFRWSAPPYLVVGDLLAYVMATLQAWSGADALIVLVMLLCCLRGTGLYRPRLSYSLLDDLPYIAGSVVAALAVAQLLATSSSAVADRLGRTALLLVLLLVVRGINYTVLRRARTGGYVRHRALILGAGHVGLRLGTSLRDHREFGLDVVGFLDPRPRAEDNARLPAPVFNDDVELADLIHDLGAKVVIVAFGTLRESALVDVLRTCDRLECEIMFVPRLFEIHAVTRDMDQVRGIPLVRVRRAPFRSVSWSIKRALDAGLAGLALLLLSPMALVCAAAVRLETGPGFLFRQQRVGLDGREFTLLKFRSLRPATLAESATLWSVSDDERLGPVGRLLRRTSFDELPQLWNVLRGDMSLVGPRPERRHFVDEFSGYVPRYMARHRVPAGLTGWAQVNGLRGDTSIVDRATFDNLYIENWSLWGDIKILIRTVDQVLRQRGS